MNSISNKPYRLSLEGRKVPVHRSQLELARELDSNGDHYISHAEIIEGYEIKEEHGSDVPGQLRETKFGLARVANPDAVAYHSYQQVGAALSELEKQYPDKCERVSLGKTAQGREIWALRITDGIDQQPAYQRTGVVITGCHHAREWMTVEVPLDTAQTLLADTSPEGRERLARSEVWIVPLVNPDGYEYSRRYDNMWRKNRQPVDIMVDGKRVQAKGVDPNRNYDDRVGGHEKLYRSAKDKPFVTQDDFEPGNDDPNSEVFRGSEGASSREVQAMLKLQLGHQNIRGVLDYHSYGETVMYPWGYTHRAPKGARQMEQICESFNEAAGSSLKVQQSAGMYTTLGSSNDVQFANGIVGLTLETNGCFQPRPAAIGPTCERYTRGNLAFIDQIVERAEQGSLPERVVPEPWVD